MKFIFNLEPVAQARTRYTSKPYPHEYDPTPVKRFKKQLNALATKQMAEKGIKPFDDAIKVDMIVYRPIQKSVSKIECMRRHLGVVLPSVKPDADNYIKSIWDALNGAIWSDDSKITDTAVKKRYSLNPRIEVEVVKAETKRPIKYVKKVWYYVNEDGSLEPVWRIKDENQNKRTDH